MNFFRIPRGMILLILLKPRFDAIELWKFFVVQEFINRFQLLEVAYNAPKSVWNRILSCDDICIFLWNAPKSNTFIFGPFPGIKIFHVIFLQIPTLKVKIFDFGAFQRKMQMSSHDKILFRMHFEVQFHGIHRTLLI